jgi:3-hydroxybutyryl-CoA dehydrogenase
MSGEKTTTAFDGRLGIVGTGVMGAGLAQRALQAGHGVTLLGRDANRLARRGEDIERGAKLMVRRRKAEAQTVEAGLRELRLGVDPADLADCPLVVEAIVEEEEAKTALYRRLDAHLGPETVLASNTSSLRISRLADASGRPARFLGLHFMNPVPQSKLAELVRHPALDAAALERGAALLEALGLVGVEVEDTPGFLVNRMLMPFLAEAARLVDDGPASAEAIDTAMRLGCGHPLGPLALADLIGLDVVLSELETLAADLGPRYAPPGSLRRLVEAGRLGRKTGHGFHRYGRAS